MFDYIHFKHFYMAKDIIQSIDNWQVCQMKFVALMTKGSYLRYRVLLQTDKRQLSRKTGKICKEDFTEQQVQLSCKHEKCSSSLVVIEIKINKIIMKHHCIPIRLAKIEKNILTFCICFLQLLFSYYCYFFFLLSSPCCLFVASSFSNQLL